MQTKIANIVLIYLFFLLYVVSKASLVPFKLVLNKYLASYKSVESSIVFKTREFVSAL